MPSNVIQGSFPHGGPRFAHAVQRKAAPGVAPRADATPLPPQFAHIHAPGGQPLPQAVRQRMEAVFGASFADVRVHVGHVAQAMGAVAITHGSNIHFAPGHYNPSTAHGLRVLGHELAHVVQQRSGRVRNPFGSGTAVVHDGAMESEAARMAVRAATHHARAIQPLRGRGVVQRLKNTDLQVQTALGNGTINNYLIALYNLAYRHHNDNVIYLAAACQQHDNYSAANSQYWYRCMTATEFDQLNRNDRFHGDTYGGIAPNRLYCRGYLTNDSDGTHIVEFKTPSAGFLYNLFNPKKLEWGDLKAEGGGSYGLGPTGNGKGAAGAAFNKLLATRQITWELVDLKMANPL